MTWLGYLRLASDKHNLILIFGLLVALTEDITLNLSFRAESPEECNLIVEALQQDNQGMVEMKCNSDTLEIRFLAVRISSIYSLTDEILNHMENVKKIRENVK